MTVWTAAAHTRRARVPGRFATLTHQAKTTARRLKATALTAAGLACIDTGAFQLHHVAGWAVTGISVLIFDWKIQEGTGD